MPYIEKGNRHLVAPTFLDLNPSNAGELNFVLTTIIRDYFSQHGNYQGINDIVGALEGCKAEFQRRVVGKYEDQKIEDNGDVY